MATRDRYAPQFQTGRLQESKKRSGRSLGRNGGRDREIPIRKFGHLKCGFRRYCVVDPSPDDHSTYTDQCICLEHSYNTTMSSYGILIDDGLCVASSANSTFPDMAAAIRSTAQTALLLATDDRNCAIGTAPIECEIEDREGGEICRFSVAVTMTYHTP